MRVRHRIPSIFNLSMVDVLCCALGCVILLWLLNLREAKHHEETAEEQNRQVTSLLSTAREERDNAYGMVVRLDSERASVAEERDGLQKDLARRRGELADLERKLKASNDRITALEGDLQASEKRYDSAVVRAKELERKWKDSVQRATAVEKDLQDTDKRADAEARCCPRSWRPPTCGSRTCRLSPTSCPDCGAI
jgi:rubrerythrin